MTDRDKRLVLTVFHELDKLPYRQLNTILGSLTIKEMHNFLMKLETEEFCKIRGLKFDDMTDDDFEDYALWKAEKDGYSV